MRYNAFNFYHRFYRVFYMRRFRDWLHQFGQQLNLFDWVDEPVSSKNTDAIDPKPSLQPALPFFESVEGLESPYAVTLQEQIVPYRLERTRRKTVGMMVDAQGLRVRASPRVSIVEIERILQSKATWILRHLDKAAQQRRQPIVSFVPNLDVADGTQMVLLARAVRIRWGSVQQLPDWQSVEPELWVKLPRIRSNLSDEAVSMSRQNALANALGECLLEYLHQRAQQYAQTFDLRYRDIVLSNAKTLWGTCRRDGLIRMNWRLVFLDVALVDYVLAHELAHTRHMNHSAAFWLQVERMCPDYRSLRRQLKQFDLRMA